jgi:LytS/YehU family sensor histidine kinase
LFFAAFLWLAFALRIKQLKEKERTQNDRIKYKFETLRSQINPHFLFNSFNTLSGLIESKPDDAIDYVDHLSDFFRKILLHKEKDLISLDAELQVLNDYIFIQKKRFGENLQIEISPTISRTNFLIAPMTLQLLAENAIKHNVVSKARPLNISIQTIENNYLEVRNVLQAKSTQEASTQIGLSNIISRYAILQKRKVIVEQNETFFIVKIPLIEDEV